MTFWIYVLRCADGSYYVGHTTDPEARLVEHNLGLGATHTREHRPVALVHAEEFATRFEAFRRERQLKGWSRAKKEALIGEDFDALSALARSTARRDREAARGGPSTAGRNVPRPFAQDAGRGERDAIRIAFEAPHAPDAESARSIPSASGAARSSALPSGTPPRPASGPTPPAARSQSGPAGPR